MIMLLKFAVLIAMNLAVLKITIHHHQSDPAAAHDQLVLIKIPSI